MWSMTGHAVVEHVALQPLPGRRRSAPRPRRTRARACEWSYSRAGSSPERMKSADRGRRGEHAGDAELLDDAPERLRVRGGRSRPRTRASCSRRAAAHRRCSCGRPPSRCREVDHQTSAGRSPKHQRRHGVDVDLVAAVDVDGELGLRGRAGGGEDVRRLVRLHRHVVVVAAPRPARGTRPTSRRARPEQRGVAPRFSTTTCSTRASGARQRVVDDLLQPRTPCPSIGDVGGEHGLASRSRRCGRPARFAPKPAKTTQWIAPMRTRAA